MEQKLEWSVLSVQLNRLDGGVVSGVRRGPKSRPDSGMEEALWKERRQPVPKSFATKSSPREDSSEYPHVGYRARKYTIELPIRNVVLLVPLVTCSPG